MVTVVPKVFKCVLDHSCKCSCMLSSKVYGRNAGSWAIGKCITNCIKGLLHATQVCTTIILQIVLA